MKTLLRPTVFFSALVLAATVGCAGMKIPSGGGGKATAKSAKDVAACEKMCAVAGDAEDNKAAVEKCQKKCH